MIVNNYTQMKKHLPSLMMKGGDAVDLFESFLEQSQDSLSDLILGEEITAQLEVADPGDPKLRRMAERIISLDAYIHAVPELDLMLTDSGFVVTSNEAVAPASRDRVNALLQGLSVRKDESCDALVLHLMQHKDSWRETEQFAALSAGLILTWSEFKTLAVKNAITATVMPKTWKEFYELIPGMNEALMTDVASYISREYAEELLEKIRDKEPLLAKERKVLGMIKQALCAYALQDQQQGSNIVLQVYSYMKSNLESFPTFAASPESQTLGLTHDDTPIFSMI